MANKILNNVVLKWCFFNKEDQFGKYGCQVMLNKEQAKAVKGWGLNVKKDEEGNLFIKIRRDKDRGTPSVIDINRNPVTCTVANGAIADIIFDVFEYKKFGGGITSRLEKVRLRKYEAYGDDVDFDDEDVVADDIGEEESPF